MSKRKRTKKVKIAKVKKVKKVFYKCKKTLYVGDTNEVIFKKGVKYLLIRKTKTKTEELKGLILYNENDFETIVYYNSWGIYFKRKNKK